MLQLPADRRGETAPLQLSKAAIGSPNPFIQSLPSALSFSKSLEGSERNNFTQAR
jgi:hypothetical protein